MFSDDMWNPKEILNISYDVVLLQTRSAILRAAGHVVATADTLTRALSLLRQGTFDLVIVGHSLPPTDTRTLLAAVRANSMPALLLTRYVEQAPECKADMVLPAIEGPLALLNAVDSLLQDRIFRPMN